MLRRAILTALILFSAFSVAVTATVVGQDRGWLPGVQATLDTTVVRYRFPNAEWLGWTFCDENDQPQFWINGRVILQGQQWLFDEVVAHEAEHVRQIERAGGCGPWKMWWQSPRARYESELGAYCVGLAAAVRRGADHTARQYDIIRILQYLFGDMVGNEKIADDVREACGAS